MNNNIRSDSQEQLIGKNDTNTGFDTPLYIAMSDPSHLKNTRPKLCQFYAL